MPVTVHRTRLRRSPLAALLGVWARLLVAAIAVGAIPAAAHARTQAEPLAAENSPLGLARNPAPACALPELLQAPESPLESSFAYGQTAADNAYATRGIPQLAARTGAGANRAMLGEAVAHVKALGGTAAQKADLFEALAGQISSITKGGWQAARGLGTGGSHVFLGGAGEALIIDSAGAVFRGSLGNGVGLGAKIGEFAVDFAKLRPL